MDDDFNTPLAVSMLISSIERLRTYAESHPRISCRSKDSAVKEVLELCQVFGILQKDAYKEKLPEDAAALINEREKLRSGKRFGEADAIRTRLEKDLGITVEDSEYGTIWYRKK
jgi:cysteinyl-tRNA synthetase